MAMHLMRATLRDGGEDPDLVERILLLFVVQLADLDLLQGILQAIGRPDHAVDLTEGAFACESAQSISTLPIFLMTLKSERDDVRSERAAMLVEFEKLITYQSFDV